ncbi:MAG: hypothetical protein BWY63_02834 [Chloroflexi bacterium ADurb.Bin360]|nr:MAG: hypothetical protein BWY63_02834 [Chloroflexi bacterium ADurb.Bin360]
MLPVPAEILLGEEAPVDAISELGCAGAPEFRSTPGAAEVFWRTVIGDFRVRGAIIYIKGAPARRNLHFWDAILKGPGFSGAHLEIAVDQQIAACLRLRRHNPITRS